MDYSLLQKFEQLFASCAIGSGILFRIQMPAIRPSGLVDVFQEQIHRSLFTELRIHIDLPDQLPSQQPQIVQMSLDRDQAEP
jgi:hypothetical protein